MAVKFGSSVLLIDGLAGQPTLSDQQHIASTFLQRLGERYLLPSHLPPAGQRPFDAWPAVLMPPSALAGVAVAETYVFTCMFHIGNSASRAHRGYLRVALTGRRSGSSRPVMANPHRLICWLMHGPPPSRLWDEYVAGHLCGESTCLCPAHILWLTRADDLACRAWHGEHGRGYLKLWRPPSSGPPLGPGPGPGPVGGGV